MEECGKGEVIPRMCVRSTFLEVRKLLCVTRSFEEMFVPGRLERMIRWKPIWLQITPTHEADGGVELAVRRGVHRMIFAVLRWLGFAFGIDQCTC